jgi:putative membrane protein
MQISIESLPAINSTFNALSTICLISGYIAIKKNNKKVHIFFMLSALLWSTVFLICYLIYHYHVGSKPFPNLGWIKTLYLFILIPHIILAAVMVPLILKTFWHAFRSEFILHKKWAKITLPIWLYVSVTGVLIYFMLYHWFLP